MTQFRLNTDGTFDVLDGHRTVFAGAFSRVTYHDAQGIERDVRTTRQNDNSTLRGADEQIEIELRVVEDLLALLARNIGGQAVTLDAFEVLSCETERSGEIKLGRASELFYLHHGWQSWSGTEIRALSAPEVSFDGDDFSEKHLPYGAAAPGERTSNAFLLVSRALAPGLKAETGEVEQAALIGFETGANQFSQIRVDVRGDEIARLRAIAYADGAQLDAGAIFFAEMLMFGFGGANELYETYAARVAKSRPRRGSLTHLQGWCSWYYYFGENTAEDIRANVSAIAAQNVPLDLILIDDGYQTAIGDWTSINPDKFPDGMKKIADEIHTAGKLAGLWLAPFGAVGGSQLAQAHPEFFLLDHAGNRVRAWSHWNEDVYALDLARPDVLDWLGELFHTVCHDWGYDAVKIDFIFAGALPGKHFEPRSTRAQAYRRGLDAIAATVGDQKIILGCGAPQLASVGLVDTMRVSQDVNFVWEPGDPANRGAVSTRHAVQNTLLRAPLNQKWWLNDPDCVIVRPRGDLNAMTRSENRTLATVASLTGSILLDSDNVPNLKRPSLNDLRAILPALQRTARVRKWFPGDGGQPSELELELEGGQWILASINWTKRTRETVIRLPGAGSYRVYDFWARQDLGIHRGRVKIPAHAPHQTIVLHCLPASRSHKEIAWSTHIGGAR